MAICKAISRLMIGGLLCTLGSVWVVSTATAKEKSKAYTYTIRIDISKPVLHLYREGKLYRTFPIALGSIETQTPIGKWRIVDKQRNWGSGFGTRWMGLDVPWGTYGIHGTNRPEFIGQYASNGCIRMLNPDVEWLYDLVPMGTPVIITGNPLEHLRVLKLGNIGADVQWVQQRLKQAGYFREVCDGKFDGGMQFSLFYFELARGLTPDGVVGMDDYQALGLKSVSLSNLRPGFTDLPAERGESDFPRNSISVRSLTCGSDQLRMTSYMETDIILKRLHSKSC